MVQAEYESALLNTLNEDKKNEDDLIQSIDDGIMLRNTVEARVIINKLSAIVKMKAK
jgi:hypothetical protein